MIWRKKKHSPLKHKPLRVAGQSLDEKMEEFFDDHMLGPFMVVLFLWIIAGLEWYRYYLPFPPKPGLFTAMAGCMTLYVGWRLTHMFRQYRALKLGRDGERAVAQVLDLMRESGFRVFHDVPGPDFNVDHLLVGTKGVYVIETKTISKPHADAEIQYDGERVAVPGVKLDRDPVRQATAIAKWVRELIDETCGIKCRVRPVVLFPGWHVQKMPRPLPPVWVMNGKELNVFAGNEPDVLKPEDARLIISRISRHMRDDD